MCRQIDRNTEKMIDAGQREDSAGSIQGGKLRAQGKSRQIPREIWTRHGRLHPWRIWGVCLCCDNFMICCCLDYDATSLVLAVGFCWLVINSPLINSSLLGRLCWLCPPFSCCSRSLLTQNSVPNVRKQCVFVTNLGSHRRETPWESLGSESWRVAVWFVWYIRWSSARFNTSLAYPQVWPGSTNMILISRKPQFWSRTNTDTIY